MRHKRILMIMLLQSIVSHATDTNTSANFSESRLPLKELRTFTQVFEQIRLGYVEEITDIELLENAITGLLSNLDPHSTYLNTKDYDDLQENASGEYGGLGIEVIGENGVIKIIAPIDGTPAAQAGLEAGDLITELDNSPIRGMDLQNAIDKLRGVNGTSIKLTIFRKGQKAPLNFDITRNIIQISSVRSRILKPNYGYVRIAQFQTSTGEDFVTEVDKLIIENGSPLNGLIIDLRNNPGGLVPASVSVADSLINSGTLVYTEGRLQSSNRRFNATSGDILSGVPIAVLINGGSASASEIVAGALQDSKRAIIVGTQSFGKGSVQTVMPLDNGRAVKLTTALYFTPSGKSIQAEGITPDIIIEPAEITPYKKGSALREKNLDGHLGAEVKNDSDSDLLSDTASYPTDDNQLYEALNLLRGFQLLSEHSQNH